MLLISLLEKYKPLSAIILLCALSTTPIQATTTHTNSLDTATVKHRINNIQLPFIFNSGQVNDSSVQYYARTLSGTVFVTDVGELVYLLPKKGEKSTTSWALSEALAVTASVSIEARSPSSTQIRHFNGNSKSPETTAFNEISLGQPYDGIEVVVRAYNNNVEKLFMVSPGANPHDIRVPINGSEGLSIAENGSLKVATGLGTVVFTKPVAYQQLNGQREYIDVAYQVADESYSFKLGDWDKTHPLIIDPLVESTFLGGGGQDRVRDLEFSNNEVFITGWTSSIDFPATLGAVNNFSGGLQDAFIARMSPDLSTMLSASYLGGPNQEWGVDLDIADDGSVYMAGYANSSVGIPTTTGAYRESGVGAYVAKFSNDLGTLHAATYVGTSSSDITYGVAVHGGNVYLTGRTFSPSYPTTPGAYDESCGTDGNCNPTGSFGLKTPDAFVAKFNSDLSSLLASTFLGGSGLEAANDITTDDNGNVYVTGETRSSNFPTTAASYSDSLPPQSTFPSAFVSKFDSALSNLLSSSFLNGSDGSNVATAITLANGSVYIAGGVNDDNLPTSADAYDRSVNGNGYFGEIGIEGDIFIARMDTSLQTLQAATYYGGASGDTPENIDVNVAGAVIVSGRTRSSNLPTSSNAFDSSFNGEIDAFIAAFDDNLTTLQYASYLGGPDVDRGMAVASNDAGQVYIGGLATSANFPTTSGAFDSSYGGNEDGFVALFDVSGNSGGGGGNNIAPTADAGADFNAIHRTIVLLDGTASNDPDGSIASYQWKQISGKTVRLKNTTSSIANFRAPRVKRNKTKVLVFELTVTDDQGETDVDTVTVTVTR